MLRGSIRRRLAITIGGGCVVVLIGVGAASIHAVRGELQSRLDANLVSAAEGALAASGLLTPEQGSELTEALPASQYTILVVRPEGIRVVVPEAAGSGPDLAALDLDTLRDRSDPFTVASADGGAGQRVVAVPLGEDTMLVYSQSLAGIDTTVQELTVRLLAICAVGVAALVAIVLLAARSIVRPIETMVDSAREIGAGDLGTRLPEDQPDTDTQQLAVALNAMLSRLAEAFEAKDRSEAHLRQFLSDASHELRTPLTTARAHAELLSTAGSSPEQHDRSVLKIQAETRRMSRLVDDLFLLARLDQGQALEPQEVDLAGVLGDAVEDLLVLQPERTVVLDVAKGLSVWADESRLRQAIDNLLANVRLHAGADARLDIRAREVTEGVAISVRDTGPGVPHDDLDKVFERFFRSDANGGPRPGAGLGLAIVAGVVAGHGGTVRAQASDPGLEITITLPRADPSGAASTTQPSS